MIALGKRYSAFPFGANYYRRNSAALADEFPGGSRTLGLLLSPKRQVSVLSSILAIYGFCPITIT